MFHV
jgi:hypothetical protein